MSRTRRGAPSAWRNIRPLADFWSRATWHFAAI